MAAAILGRVRLDRKLAWRDPPGAAVDTSEPDVVSLATSEMADPLGPVRDGWRAGSTFGGTDGMYSRAEGVREDDDPRDLFGGPRESRPTVGGPRFTEAGTVDRGFVCNDDPRSCDELALRDSRRGP